MQMIFIALGVRTHDCYSRAQYVFIIRTFAKRQRCDYCLASETSKLEEVREQFECAREKKSFNYFLKLTIPKELAFSFSAFLRNRISLPFELNGA